MTTERGYVLVELPPSVDTDAGLDVLGIMRGYAEEVAAEMGGTLTGEREYMVTDLHDPVTGEHVGKRMAYRYAMTREVP